MCARSLLETPNLRFVFAQTRADANSSRHRRDIVRRSSWHPPLPTFSLFSVTCAMLCRFVFILLSICMWQHTILAVQVVLPHSWYLSRMKNQHVLLVSWTSTGTRTKYGSIWRTHIPRTFNVENTYTSCVRISIYCRKKNQHGQWDCWIPTASLLLLYKQTVFGVAVFGTSF